MLRWLRLVVLALLMGVMLAMPKAASGAGLPLYKGIMVNTFGYLPEQPKRLAYVGDATSFTVVDNVSGRTVFTGSLQPDESPDLTVPGMQTGDFTSLHDTGEYYIRIGDAVSRPFRIAPNLYGELVWNGVNYLQRVRGGDSVTGFRAWTHNISHLDDGKLPDAVVKQLGLSGSHIDMVGGWYDATDVRYWTSSWMALEFVQQVAEWLQPGWDSQMLLDELKWGNSLFLKSIMPGGEVLNPSKSDNYWTDNIIGTKDDRLVASRINDGGLAYQLVYLQLRLARIYSEKDPVYANVMRQAALRALTLLEKRNAVGGDLPSVGMRVLAYLEMYRYTSEEDWLVKARQAAAAILFRQEKNYTGSQQLIRGFFYANAERTKTPDIRAHEGYFLTALVELAQVDAGNPQWLEALKLYCTDYLLPLSRRNPFHLIPARAFVWELGSRKIDDSFVSYRYFRVEGDGGNATGINPSILSQAAVLLEVGRLTGNVELTNLGWEQINFVMGMNPCGASTIEGAGYVPTNYVGGQGVTRTFPRVPGAVLNGFASNAADDPILDNSWEASEYWLPQFGWLGTFLAAAQVDASVPVSALLPQTAVLKVGREQRFYPAQASSADVTWLVNGISGGNAIVGTVQDGLYKAPLTPPDATNLHDGQYLILSANGADGTLLGTAHIRVINSPATPVITEAKVVDNQFRVSWNAAEGADTYNVQVMIPAEGFYRSVINTADTYATLPIESVAGNSVRVEAVSHTLGYSLPSEAVQP